FRIPRRNGDSALRKPIVEKKRRDRINSCIEQLKVILEKEFHKQEPNSKLEKADILEMTVSFLRHFYYMFYLLFVVLGATLLPTFRYRERYINYF
uniref:Transcription factor HES-5 n=1 Tax=Gouania willdenowi TaxID=441366 RepID=A0A8C5GAU1_GOUWI